MSLDGNPTKRQLASPRHSRQTTEEGKNGRVRIFLLSSVLLLKALPGESLGEAVNPQRPALHEPRPWRLSFLDALRPLIYNLPMITTITGKNQVTLPAEIVKALALTPGTRLDWRIGPDGSIVAQPCPSRARLAAAFLGSGRRLLKPGDDPVAELVAERGAEDAEADAAQS